MAAELIRREIENAGSVIFIAHRIELVKQTNGKLEDFDVEYGTIMAGYDRTLFPHVQVASIQTLSRRIDNGRVHLYPPTLIIIDECHHTAAESYLKIIKEFPNANVLGLTATPIRGDGVGLGGPEMFQDIVYAPTTKELTQIGHLVPLKYYAPTKPELEKVKVLAGEYNLRQLENKMDQSELVGDIVENFSRICPDRQTVVFSSGVRHSKHIRDAFLGAGIIAEHLDARTDIEERAAILGRLASGETQVVCNCMVLTEGWDCPPVSCIILARPTKSLGLFLQMAGRGLRPSPKTGKTNTIIIDHSGAVYEHGRVNEEREWSLDPYKTIVSNPQERKKAAPITCKQCKFVYESEPKCPECGFVPVISAKEFKVLEGDLAELEKNGELNSLNPSEYRKALFYRELKYIAQERGYKPGWVGYKFKHRYQCWPNRKMQFMGPVKPSPETLRIVGKKAPSWKKHNYGGIN